MRACRVFCSASPIRAAASIRETAAKLFKPFFTTRASGTGLGLSVAQHIAMKHGGVVLAENLPAGGARFSIWLPTTPKA